MSYHNFAARGYQALNGFLGNEWDLGDGARMRIHAPDAACNGGSITFTRPQGRADRIDDATSAGVTGGAARNPLHLVVYALVTALRTFGTFSDNSPITQTTTIYGLGYDDGHSGSRERHYDTFREAVAERGQPWIGRYREAIACGLFFAGMPNWWEWGALASEHAVMLVRLTDDLRVLQIKGFIPQNDGSFRVTDGTAQSVPPQLRAS